MTNFRKISGAREKTQTEKTPAFSLFENAGVIFDLLGVRRVLQLPQENARGGPGGLHL